MRVAWIPMSDPSNYHDGEKAEQCYFCPARHDLQEHHIIPDRFNGPDKKRNLTTVCTRCHKKLERLYDKRFYEFFGIDDEEGKRRSHQPCELRGCDNRATREMLDTRGAAGLLMCDDCARDYAEGSDYETLDDATNMVVNE